jgi:hypothetical protein
MVVNEDQLKELTEKPSALSTHRAAMITGQHCPPSRKGSRTEVREGPGRRIECGHLSDSAERPNFKLSVVAFLLHAVVITHE